jgi:hypothetical protein
MTLLLRKLTTLKKLKENPIQCLTEGYRLNQQNWLAGEGWPHMALK